MTQKYIVGDIFMVDNQPRKVTWIGASYPRVEIDGVLMLLVRIVT